MTSTTNVQVSQSLLFIFLGYIPRSGTAASYGDSELSEEPPNFLQWLQRLTFPPATARAPPQPLALASIALLSLGLLVSHAAQLA